jgi:hypothetical protein
MPTSAAAVNAVACAAAPRMARRAPSPRTAATCSADTITSAETRFVLRLEWPVRTSASAAPGAAIRESAVRARQMAPTAPRLPSVVPGRAGGECAARSNASPMDSRAIPAPTAARARARRTSASPRPSPAPDRARPTAHRSRTTTRAAPRVARRPAIAAAPRRRAPAVRPRPEPEGAGMEQAASPPAHVTTSIHACRSPRRAERLAAISPATCG